MFVSEITSSKNTPILYQKLPILTIHVRECNDAIYVLLVSIGENSSTTRTKDGLSGRLRTLPLVSRVDTVTTHSLSLPHRAKSFYSLLLSNS